MTAIPLGLIMEGCLTRVLFHFHSNLKSKHDCGHLLDGEIGLEQWSRFNLCSYKMAGSGPEPKLARPCPGLHMSGEGALLLQVLHLIPSRGPLQLRQTFLFRDTGPSLAWPLLPSLQDSSALRNFGKLDLCISSCKNFHKDSAVFCSLWSLLGKGSV